MLVRNSISFAVALAIAGCRSVEPSGTTAGASSAAVESLTPREAAPPVLLVVSGPASVATNSDIVVTVHLLRQVPTQAPMVLRATSPVGTTIVTGILAETIKDGAATDIVRRFALHIDAVPTDDVVFTLEMGDAKNGLHAVQRYRFGRAEPQLPNVGAGGTPSPP